MTNDFMDFNKMFAGLVSADVSDAARRGLIHPAPAAPKVTQHPMVCGATFSALLAGDHVHVCGQPVADPGQKGAPEHRCVICGGRWIEVVRPRGAS